MSLPKAFSTPEEYFTKCLQFFTRYEYLINVPNTHVLVENTFDNIDCNLDNIEIELNELNLDNLKDQSKYIKDFLTELELYKVEYERVEDIPLVEEEFEAPIGLKKRYEVLKLADEVAGLCLQNECDTVVDIGSGLGYLDQRFHATTGYNVLGLECDAAHHARAIQRQNKYYESSRGRVVYVVHRVDERSDGDIQGYLKEHFKAHGPVCITGLHACADLTVDGINVFLKMEAARALVLMPCCYHRMTEEGDGFKNFPLSLAARRVSGVGALRAACLRLGAHPSHLRGTPGSLLARAALQLFAGKNNCTLKRNKRKAIKRWDSFEDYVQQAVTGYSLLPKQVADQPPEEGGSREFDTEQIMSIWHGLPKSTFKKAALYIQLQNLLQPVVENFILYDRLVYLQENGVSNVWHRKFFREDQSPRCIALLAVKDR